jgi:hypothetical protein
MNTDILNELQETTNKLQEAKDKIHNNLREIIASFISILIGAGFIKGSVIVLAKHFSIIPIFGYWEIVLLLWTIFTLRNIFLVRRK